jgi:hypothetical protein
LVIHWSFWFGHSELSAMPLPTFLPARPRVRRKRRRAPGAAPPPAAALMLVGVTGLSVIGPEIEMNLVFNTTEAQPLSSVNAADPAKWTARYQGQRYVGSLLGDVQFDTAYLQLTPAGPEAGADVLSYANAPSDVSDSLGRFLGAFAGFPL